ncbi:hypothetical protein Hanom_Chr11g01005311 [Helianthus anomalus]
MQPCMIIKVFDFPFLFENNSPRSGMMGFFFLSTIFLPPPPLTTIAPAFSAASASAIFDIFFCTSAFNDAKATSVSDSLSFSNFSSFFVSSSSDSSFLRELTSNIGGSSGSRGGEHDLHDV